MNLNEKCHGLLKKLEKFAEVTDYGKTKVLDLNKADRETGIKVAEVTMGSLGEVKIDGGMIHVSIPERPSVACLSSQLAGWAIPVGDRERLGSGPARILARKPSDIMERVGYHEESNLAALAIETSSLPNEKTCRNILGETGADNLIIAAFSGNSEVGLINVMARVVEMALFRLDSLGYDTNQILSAEGTAPIPALDDKVMFTSNDAIIYGGSVKMEVEDWDPSLTEKAVSMASKFHGRRFEDIFNEAGGDFYDIDHDLFAPAELDISFKGNHYHVGRVEKEKLI